MALVSIRQAADELGISAFVLRQQVRQGRIPVYDFGPRSKRVDMDEARRATRLNAMTEREVAEVPA